MANFTISFTIPDDKADMGNAQALRYYIKQLRYERLMAKAGYFKDVDRGDLYWKHRNKSWLMFNFQCERIARAYKARAAKILEGK